MSNISKAKQKVLTRRECHVWLINLTLLHHSYLSHTSQYNLFCSESSTVTSQVKQRPRNPPQLFLSSSCSTVLVVLVSEIWAEETETTVLDCKLTTKFDLSNRPGQQTFYWREWWRCRNKKLNWWWWLLWSTCFKNNNTSHWSEQISLLHTSVGMCIVSSCLLHWKQEQKL